MIKTTSAVACDICGKAEITDSVSFPPGWNKLYLQRDLTHEEINSSSSRWWGDYRTLLYSADACADCFPSPKKSETKSEPKTDEQAIFKTMFARFVNRKPTI